MPGGAGAAWPPNDSGQSSKGLAHHTAEFLELAARAARFGAWEWDIALGIVKWSPEVHELLGVSPQKFAGTCEAYLELIPAEERERVTATIQGALATGNEYAVEHRIDRPDGAAAWVAAYGSVVRDESGQPIRMLGVVTDITEKKRGEQRLRESEQRFRTLAAASIEGVVLSSGGSVVDANVAAARILRFDSPDDLVGHEIAEFVFPEDMDFVLNHVRSGTERPYVHRALCKDGSVIHVEVSGRSVTYLGRPVRMTALRDVTDRVRAAADLRQKDEIIRAIVETSQDWIWAIDLKGRHSYSNPAVESILGHSIEVLKRSPAFDFVHPDDVGQARRVLEECIAHKTGWHQLRLRWRHADGSYRSLESSAVPSVDERGQLLGFRGVDRDITDRLEMAKEKAQLERQLLHAQKMEAVGQLAGGIAHDFNNLLTAISGNVEFLAEAIERPQPDRQELRDDLDEIRQAARRSIALTGQLLAFSRRQLAQPASLDLLHTLDSLLGMLRRVLTENVRLNLRITPGLPSIYFDPSQLEQVVMNLVVNARDAMPQGGTLTLEASVTRLLDEDVAGDAEAVAGTFVLLRVSDTGHGMDRQTLTRIFEPFFTTKPEGRGTGLGLSTVYGIVHQAGGFVRVYSEPGTGTTFSLYLPATSLPAEHSADRDVEPTQLGGSETILLCEDDFAVRKVATTMLSRAGYTVLAAPSGSEALRIAEGHSGTIDLLLTDVIMPGMNGKQLSDTLGQQRPDLKTVFFSGYSADVISHHGVVDEQVELVNKPFEHRDLLQRLRRVLDGSP